MRVSFKNILLYFLGNLITTFGVNLMLKANVGIGPWDTVFENLKALTNIQFWVFNLIFNFIFLTIVIIYRKSFKSLNIILTILVQALFLFVWEGFIFKNYFPDNLIIRTTLFITSLLLIPLGLNLIIISTFPVLIYEELTFVLMDITKINNFGIVRIGFEALGVTIGLLISLLSSQTIGSIGIGTLVMTFLLGPLINFYLKFFIRFGDKGDSFVNKKALNYDVE